MKTSRLSAALMTSFALLLAISAASPDCWAVQVFFDGNPGTDFNTAANWTPAIAPGTNPLDINFIQDGLTATFSSGSTSLRGMIVGDTSFGRLEMTGGSLAILDKNVLEVGRERFPDPVGGDYNKNAVVDAADYVIWRDTLDSQLDLRADGDGNAIIEQADYDFWRARFGNVVKGGEIIMTGSSTLTSDGAIIGRRTKGLLSVGPLAVVNIGGINSMSMMFDTEDLRVGSYGAAYKVSNEPGLEADGLVIVQGALNAKELQINEHGAIGEIRLLPGGRVNLNNGLVMSLCDVMASNCGLVTNPEPLMSSKVSIIGSGGTFNVGLDPDPATPDLMPPDPLAPKRDIRSDFPTTATFSFTADAGGVTPITVVDNGAGNVTGTANIAGTKLVLSLDAYTSASPLTLINAAPGHLSGVFGTVTFLGTRTATVNYDVFNGNVFLNNFQNGAGAGTGSLAGSAVPEPSGLLMMTLTLGLLLFSFSAGAKRQTARLC